MKQEDINDLIAKNPSPEAEIQYQSKGTGMEYDDIALIEIKKLQKQNDLLTLGLLQAKNYITAIRKQYNQDCMAICENKPPELFSGFNACLSCSMSNTCRLLYENKN